MVDIYKSGSVACARYGCRTYCLLWYPRRFVTQTGTQRHEKRVDIIYKSVGYIVRSLVVKITPIFFKI